MNKVHVKKGDNVVMISGKDKGKKGKVLSVIPDKRMVLIEGINLATKHKKPKGMQQQGGIIHQESPVYSSKVKLICPKCDQPARTGKSFTKDNEKVRICKKCSEIIDVVKTDKK